MGTIRIEILNPKALSILNSLADLKLISFQKEEKQSDFVDLLTRLRRNSQNAPSIEEITAEVVSVRGERYEQEK